MHHVNAKLKKLITLSTTASPALCTQAVNTATHTCCVYKDGESS